MNKITQFKGNKERVDDTVHCQTHNKKYSYTNILKTTGYTGADWANPTFPTLVYVRKTPASYVIHTQTSLCLCVCICVCVTQYSVVHTLVETPISSEDVCTSCRGHRRQWAWPRYQQQSLDECWGQG